MDLGVTYFAQQYLPLLTALSNVEPSYSYIMHYDSTNITHETYSRTKREGKKWINEIKSSENKSNVFLEKQKGKKNYVNAIETINLISPSRMMRFPIV